MSPTSRLVMEYRDEGTCLGICIISASSECPVKGVVSESRSDSGLWEIVKGNDDASMLVERVLSSPILVQPTSCPAIPCFQLYFSYPTRFQRLKVLLGLPKHFRRLSFDSRKTRCLTGKRHLGEQVSTKGGLLFVPRACLVRGEVA